MKTSDTGTGGEARGTFRAERPLAVVTGAGRRVGRAIALALARDGCDLVCTYNTSADATLETVQGVERVGGRGWAHRLDLGDPNAVAGFGQTLATSAPRVDVLVHNASIYEPTPLNEISADAAIDHYTVNALSPLLLTQRLAGRLAESALPGGGAVVAMLDIHAIGRPRRKFSAYTMSKAALAEMVRVLARELAPRVRVNAVAPGVVAWPESGLESDPAAQARYLSRVPAGRAGTPDEAAEAVRWLALDASYCTGQVVRVDGGRWLT